MLRHDAEQAFNALFCKVLSTRCACSARGEGQLKCPLGSTLGAGMLHLTEAQAALEMLESLVRGSPNFLELEGLPLEQPKTNKLKPKEL